MRLCRFALDDLVLAGFYQDDRVVPIHQAAELFCEETGRELLLAPTDDLIDFLPPGGKSSREIRELSDWLGRLDEEALGDIAIDKEDLKLLVPVARPPKIVLLAGNYAAHVVERGGVAVERAETFPYFFLKPPSTTLTHPCDPIRIPKVSPDHVDWEAELGVVIGRRCRDVAESEASKYVAGYTIVNDVTDRRFRINPGRKPRDRDTHFDWSHGKWHDTFCPTGPCILASDPNASTPEFRITLRVNGEIKQDGNTSQMIFPVPAIISILSRFVTLEPGDLISTGTPSGVGSATGTYLKPGDLVIAGIEGIGELENPVEAED